MIKKFETGAFDERRVVLKNRIWRSLNILFACLLLITGFVAAAQEYSYSNYGIKEGLPTNTLHRIVQDKEGFIWIASESGLIRYDGTHFKTYTVDDGLPSNDVFNLFIDSKSRMWISTFKNAVCYYRKGKIYNQQNDPFLKNVDIRGVLTGHYGEDSLGNILIQYTGGGSQFPPPMLLAQNGEVISITGQRNEKIKGLKTGLVNCAGIRIEVAGAGNIPAQFAPYTDPPLMYGINTAKRQYRWLSSPSQALILDGNELIRLKFRTPYVLNGLSVINDSMAVLHEPKCTGIRLYNIRRRAFLPTYLPGYNVHQVLQDRDGNLWFTTAAYGLFKLNAVAFTAYKTGASKSTSPAVVDVRMIGKQLYAGCENGKLLSFPVPAGAGMQSLSVQGREISADLRFIREHKISGLINYKGSNFLRHDRDKIVGDSLGSIKTIQFFRDTFLFSGHSMVAIWVPKLKKFVMLRKQRATCAYYKDGRYYIGTLNGLYCLVPGKDEILLGRGTPLYGQSITTLNEGPDGSLWIGTLDHGIIRYKGGRVVAWTTAANTGLPGNQCRCLFTRDHLLYVGTDKGLCVLDVSSAQPVLIEKYGEPDGFAGGAVNTIWADSTNVYIGAATGLYTYDRANRPLHDPCDLKMEEITVSGQQFAADTGNFVLAHHDNNIRFGFTGITFLSSGYIYYNYRLLGLDDQWRTTTQTELNYPSLPSGNYTLQLYAVNKFGRQSNLVERQFAVRKTLQETWWFRIGIVVVVALIAWLLARTRIRRIRRQEQEQRELQQKIAGMEQMALRAQMNPHFIFNSLNSIQGYILRHDAKGANRYLSRFAALIRQSLDNSVRMYITLDEEGAFLANYLELEYLQLEGRLQYVITIDPAVNADLWMIPNMVIQPFVENAIKHGTDPASAHNQLSVIFQPGPNEKVLQCIIEDHGKGIYATRLPAHERQHEPRGTTITQKRIDTLNQLSNDDRIFVKTESPAFLKPMPHGTRVILEFYQ